jgi:hypothetical protein
MKKFFMKQINFSSMNNSTTYETILIKTGVWQKVLVKSETFEHSDDWEWIKENVEDWDRNREVWNWNPLPENAVKADGTEKIVSYKEVD